MTHDVSNDHHHHGFKIKGAWHRAKLEYEYFMCTNWPITAVGEFWDSVTSYDDINENTYSYFRRFTDGYSISTINNDSYILEVTPRTGNGTVYFHERGKVSRAVGADVSKFQINIYKDNLTSKGINFNSVELIDYTFPLADNEFDAVLSFETIEHMGQPGVFLSEIARVLKPGGEVILTCPNILWEPVHWFAAIFELHHSEGPHNFLTRKELFHHFAAAGLIVEREIATVLIPGGPRWLTSINEWLERNLPWPIVRSLALRRLFRLRKPISGRA